MDKAFNRTSVVLMFVFPAFLVFSLFVVVTVFWAASYSVYDWNGMGEKTFVGFKNYLTLLQVDRNFWTSVKNTLFYTFWQILLQVFGGLLIAIFLTRVFRFRATLQTLYYIPVVISTVAITQIFGKLLSVTPPGVVNSLFALINPDWRYLEWVSNPRMSLFIVAFVEGYKYVGLYMIIFYAALVGVPEELGEAATIDGANLFQQYWHIKIPYIRPVIIANVVLVLNGSLRSFDFSYLLTRGGPGNSSELMATYMYKQAFSSLKYGYGSAVAILIVIMCLIIGSVFRKLSRDSQEVI
jgi:raffinose/stachyose/melibiose transport system permease protein